VEELNKLILLPDFSLVWAALPVQLGKEPVSKAYLVRLSLDSLTLWLLFCKACSLQLVPRCLKACRETLSQTLLKDQLEDSHLVKVQLKQHQLSLPQHLSQVPRQQHLPREQPPSL
jgi:hypothetical protein